VHFVAGLVALVLVSLKAKVPAVPALAVVPPAEPPKGFVRWETLAFLSCLALAGVVGCATLKGASASTSVTLADGKNYTLTVGDAGGCVVGTGWYAIPHTPLECNKVCIDVSPGGVVPGATCRIVGRPETEFTFDVPIPTS
jgi:hypothetical protein